MSEAPIRIEGLNHSFGAGELRRQVLFDVSAEIAAGEIVILTGPSGSGKTTLLTLIGALRSAQEGSLRVLGRELRDADEATLVGVRRRIGYVFQAHNLLDALTAQQNVAMPLELEPDLSEEERARRSAAALARVGLGDRLDAHPGQLSGGQRQRVAIARALVRRPEIILADEPTASLDRETGRGVVELLQELARGDGVTVVLVTHDHRVLDAADRILALEDGRITSLVHAATERARPMLTRVGREVRRGGLERSVEGLDVEAFEALLGEATRETERLLEVVELAQGEAFESMLEQVAQAFLRKVTGLLGAEAATLTFLDGEETRRWSRHGAGAASVERIGSVERGIAAEVARSGRMRSVAALEADPAFDASVDADPGGGAGPLLAIPLVDRESRVYGVLEAARGAGSAPFDEEEVRRLTSWAQSLGVLLESWWRMSCACRASGFARSCPCCGEAPHPPGAPRGAAVG